MNCLPGKRLGAKKQRRPGGSLPRRFGAKALMRKGGHAGKRQGVKEAWSINVKEDVKLTVKAPSSQSVHAVKRQCSWE